MPNLAVAISPTVTVFSGHRAQATPKDLPTKLGDFLIRIATKASETQREISVVLSYALAATLGFPKTKKGDAAFLESARIAGWKVGETLYPFTFFHSHPTLPDVALGVDTWIEKEVHDYPWWTGSIVDTVSLMGQWHDATGLAVRGPSGFCVSAMLVHHYPAERNGVKNKTKPTWNPRAELPCPATADPAFSIGSWLAPGITDPSKVDRVQLDTNSAYLSQYQSALVPRWSLRHTAKLTYDVDYADRTLEKGERLREGYYHRNLAGWFKIRVGAWNEPRIPHPAGPGSKEGEVVWRTGATLRLLHELTREGKYDGIEILDSYSGRGYQVVRPVAEKLIKIIHSGEWPKALVEAAKHGAQHFHGLLIKKGALINREDWYAEFRASARTLLWRRAYQAGLKEGCWPIYFKIDAAFYPPTSVPSETHFPRSIAIGKFNPRKEILLKAGMAA